MERLKNFILLLLLFVAQEGFAQSFDTRVSATTIGKKDVLQVEYIVEDAQVEDFLLPRFNNWTVLSGPVFTNNRIQTGGLVKQVVSYSLTLQPKSTGKLLVPPAKALINNKPRLSNSVTIEVRNIDHITGRSQAPAQSPANDRSNKLEFGSDQFLRQGESAKEKIMENILVKLEVNKRTCYVGEPILVTYKLATRLRSQSRVTGQPTFKGATVIEMTTEDPLPGKEIINGKMYNTYVIRRVQLIPLQEGQLLLPEAVVENKVAFYTADDINFRDLYYNAPSLPIVEQTVALKNRPQYVDVKPLPPFPDVGPSVFSGGVGEFEVNVSAEPTIESNSTNELKIVILGEGNLQQMRVPEVKWPKSIEAFEPKIQDHEDKTYFPIRIRKTVTIPFVANQAGTVTIPPIEFTYFSPDESRYVSKRTAPIPLRVVPGSAAPVVTNDTANDDALSLNRLIIILGASVLAIIIAIVWFKERNKAKHADTTPVKEPALTKADTATAMTPAEDAAYHLYQIRSLEPAKNCPDFYKELCKQVNGYIQAKFNVEPANFKEYVSRQQGDTHLLQQLQKLQENCSLGLYTPMFTMDEAMQHRLDAIKVMTQLERENS